jgi:hypothetical protein
VSFRDIESNLTDDDSDHARCHMRLRAALCMVKLANVKVFDKAIATSDFELIAFSMQVSFAAPYEFVLTDSRTHVFTFAIIC